MITNLTLDPKEIVVSEDMTADMRMIVLPDGSTKFVNLREEYQQEIV